MGCLKHCYRYTWGSAIDLGRQTAGCWAGLGLATKCDKPKLENPSLGCMQQPVAAGILVRLGWEAVQDHGTAWRNSITEKKHSQLNILNSPYPEK
jgi:hypothetical protein